MEFHFDLNVDSTSLVFMLYSFKDLLNVVVVVCCAFLKCCTCMVLQWYASIMPCVLPCVFAPLSNVYTFELLLFNYKEKCNDIDKITNAKVEENGYF